jgi:hypothetical protein
LNMKSLYYDQAIGMIRPYGEFPYLEFYLACY